MKKLLLIILVLTSANAFAQFRDQANERPNVFDGVSTGNAPSLIMGFFNPANFKMTHSYNLSYSSFGSNGLALGVYTNSMFYKFADNLNLQVDASLVHSPYSSFGRDLTDQINGVYISKAALNYQPFKDFRINIQYRRMPLNYNGYYNGYYNDYSRFNNFMYDEDPFFGR